VTSPSDGPMDLVASLFASGQNTEARAALDLAHRRVYWEMCDARPRIDWRVPAQVAKRYRSFGLRSRMQGDGCDCATCGASFTLTQDARDHFEDKSHKPLQRQVWE
jgi:hypothetical protein